MRRVSVLPNMITAFGLACGLFIIFKISMIKSLSEEPEVMMMTVMLLLLAGLADLLDGAVARAVGAESEFGGFFDSLSDAVTFGVAPSVMILKTLSLPPGHEWGFFVNASAMIYTICGVLRLARYNVEDLEKRRKPKDPLGDCKDFTGLPIPAAAGAVVSANLLLFTGGVRHLFQISEMGRVYIMSITLVLIGYLMLSRMRFPSMKALHVRLPSFPLAFFTVVIAVFIFYGIFYHFPIIFAASTWFYILAAVGFSVYRKIASKS